MGLKLVTAPTETLISLKQAKLHLRLDHDEDDDLLVALIQAATDYCDGPEGFLGRALAEQTWDYYLDEFPEKDVAIKLPLPPLIGVDGIFYQDSAGDEQTMDTGDYVVDDSMEPGRVWLTASGSWPTVTDDPHSIRIRFRAGYLDLNSPPLENVPQAIKAAMKLLLGTLYENRETIVIGQTAVELPWAAEQLLRRYRVHTAIA